MLRDFTVAWRKNVPMQAPNSGAFARFFDRHDDYFTIDLEIACRQTESSNRIDDFF